MLNHEAPKPARMNGAPAALMLAEAVDLVCIRGEFDVRSQTWSDREFACAGAKKHNEAM
jgi:hypothetical protein